MTPDERARLILLQRMEALEKRVLELENEVERLKKVKKHGTQRKDAGAEG